jgi:hypothetical protein
MSELTSDVSSAEWFRRVNVKALSDEVRRKILERVKEELGFTRALEVLDATLRGFTIDHFLLEHQACFQRTAAWGVTFETRVETARARSLISPFPSS